MDFHAGWSMISLPVVSVNASTSALFPDAVVIYKYERAQGYVRVSGSEQLKVGRGYWILFNEEQSYKLNHLQLISLLQIS